MIDPQGAETGPAYQMLGHIDALPAGTVLGEFEIQGLLGFGGFGMVYRGYDNSLQRAVAIKEYLPSALVARTANQELSARSSADVQTFQAGLKSFIAEARLLARFDHPSLVKVYRFWEANNTAYMAMPLYQGITLKQARLQMSGPPPEDWLRVVMWSVLEALKVLHSSDALHRDVSPDNIFLQDTGPPVLLDLGAARLAVMEGNKKHTAVLKVNYAPIEQYADVSDLREGPWTDLYALAAVVHGCICNEAPLPATFRVVRDRLPAMAKIAKTTQTHFGQSYSSAFVKAVDHALAVQPGDRPQSVEAFAKELKLRSVSQSQRFDWRTALGDSVSLSAAASGSAAVAFGASATVADTVPFASAQLAKASPVSSPKPDEAKPAVFQRKFPGWVWGLGLAGCLLAVGSIIWSSRETAKISKPEIALPVAMASAPVQSTELQAPVVTEAPPPALIPLTAVSEPVGSPVARVQPRLANAVRSPAAAKPPEDHRMGGGKPVQDGPSAPVSKPEPPAVVRQIESPKSKLETTILCADSNLFTRPMCIYRECQKPEFRSLQTCVEDRKRWEERDKINRP
jgi:serine/threonine protein kinase